MLTRRMRSGFAVWCSAAVLISGCGDQHPLCTGYPDQESSSYVLPWPAGGEFPVLTGNCRNDLSTHSGDRRYAYDFRMSVGSLITAARGGTVVVVDDHNSDADHEFGHENVVFVSHDDGTLSLYFHLRQSGALVRVGQVVRQGEPVGTVGTSGSIGRDLVPHLHFEVASQTRPTIRSLPVSFRNTRPHPSGLVEGQSYRAEGL
jgi:murein DD-endopeptidase MepM/ murein hydrolase activator NlpD